MSYKRQVHCSHCHGRGHNKAGCPDYKERIERFRAANGDTDWRVAAYDAKRAKKASVAKNRKCSYCGDQGHNRAGCAKLKAAKSAYAARNAVYRLNVLDALIKHGFGPGTIARKKHWSGDMHHSMVIAIDWASVNMHDKTAGVVEVVSVRKLANIANSQLAWRLSRQVLESPYGPRYEIVVPTSETRIMASMPASYLEGTLGLKKVFKDKDLPLYTMRDYTGAYTNEFDPNDYSTELHDHRRY
jgi:hypothetical protein